MRLLYCPTCLKQYELGLDELEEGDQCPNPKCGKDTLLLEPDEDLCDE